MTKDLRYWVGFSQVLEIGPARLRALLNYYGQIDRAWHANPGELRAIGLTKKAIENLVRVRNKINLDNELKKLEKLNVTVLTWDSPDYPELLKSISDSPPILYLRGQVRPEDEWAIAVVGTRRATSYGRACTQKLVHDLVKNGITIVSGLAQGIDTEAHQTCLKWGGRTLAVLGCGVDIAYPPENRKLGRQIMEQGAIISEYPLGVQPLAKNFPRRNRIISGLSLGTLVVEGTIKSGACITAKNALDQGREVFAVPGTILRKNSAGPNHLIQNGAKLVTKVDDILEELNLTMVSQHVEIRAILPDNEIEATLLKNLSPEPTHIEELSHTTGLSASEVTSNLTMMELKGMVKEVGGMNYILAREEEVPYE